MYKFEREKLRLSKMKKQEKQITVAEFKIVKFKINQTNTKIGG